MSGEIIFKSAYELRNEFTQGRLTSVEAVEKVFEQIKRYNKQINAIVTLDEEGALMQAAKADEATMANEAMGPLHGIPVTVKDFFKTSGMRSTASHPSFRDNIPEEDATVVKRLKDAGAIIIGKTNMPELAMDCQTDSPLFGRTSNPWNIGRTPGGSCGGGAAAVASGMSFLDIGNDLLGSLRIPAHFCGICSLTPTEKLVPNSGLLLEKTPSAALSRMMRTGILARSVEDLKTVLKVISGPDETESDVISVKKLRDPAKPPERLRLAWTVTAGGLAVSEETAGIIESLVEKLSASGHVVDCLPDGRFDFKASRDVFLRIFYASVSASIPFPVVFVMRRLLGAKYFDTSLKRYLEVETERSKLINRMESILSDYDALLCPVTATAAFPHMKPDRWTPMGPVYKKGINVNDKNINYAEANMGFTIPFSVTGNPVTVIPAGVTGNGLPIGVQVVGRRYDDLKLLAIASTLSETAGPIGHPELK